MVAEQFNGKFKLVSSEGIEAFLAATGTNKEILEAAKNLGKDEIVNEVTASGNELAIKYYTNGKLEAEEKHVLGQQQEIETVDGRKMTTVWSMDGDKVVFTEKLGDMNAVMTIELQGDCTVSTYVSGGSKCSLKMQKM